jgi:hypothetical protein
MRPIVRSEPVTLTATTRAVAPGVSIAVVRDGVSVDARVSVIVLMNLDDADAQHIVRGLAARYVPSLK